jgi:hypothetical protein
MSHTVEIKNTAIDMTLVTDGWIGATDQAVLSLHQALLEWGEIGEMKDIAFTRDVGNPLLFTWRAERKNLTILDSTFLFDDEVDLDPDLTISLVQGWPLSVIQKGNGARTQLIQIRALVDIVSLHVTFA